MVGHDGYPVAWEHCVFCQRLDGALRLLGPYGYLAVCTICKGSGNHAQPHSASTLCSSCGGEGRWVKTSNMLTGKGGA